MSWVLIFKCYTVGLEMRDKFAKATEGGSTGAVDKFPASFPALQYWHDNTLQPTTTHLQNILKVEFPSFCSSDQNSFNAQTNLLQHSALGHRLRQSKIQELRHQIKDDTLLRYGDLSRKTVSLSAMLVFQTSRWLLQNCTVS